MVLHMNWGYVSGKNKQKQTKKKKRRKKTIKKRMIVYTTGSLFNKHTG